MRQCVGALVCELETMLKSALPPSLSCWWLGMSTPAGADKGGDLATPVNSGRRARAGEDALTLCGPACRLDMGWCVGMVLARV